MRPAVSLIVPVLFAVFVSGQKDSSTMRRDARKISDSVMDRLVAGKGAEVVNDQFKNAPESARKFLSTTLQHDRRGRPLDSRIENDGVPTEGEDVRGKKTYRVLFYQYLSTTDKHKNVTFTIAVEFDDEGKFFNSVPYCSVSPQ
jgi:hypothetical protein